MVCQDHDGPTSVKSLRGGVLEGVKRCCEENVYCFSALALVGRDFRSSAVYLFHWLRNIRRDLLVDSETRVVGTLGIDRCSLHQENHRQAVNSRLSKALWADKKRHHPHHIRFQHVSRRFRYPVRLSVVQHDKCKEAFRSGQVTTCTMSMFGASSGGKYDDQ